MQLISWMLQNTLAAACVAVIVAVVCRWRRLTPAVRHALWLIVLIKLVTPPLFQIPVPMPEWLATRWPEPVAEPSRPEDPARVPGSERMTGNEPTQPLKPLPEIDVAGAKSERWPRVVNGAIAGQSVELSAGSDRPKRLPFESDTNSNRSDPGTRQAVPIAEEELTPRMPASERLTRNDSTRPLEPLPGLDVAGTDGERWPRNINGAIARKSVAPSVDEDRSSRLPIKSSPHSNRSDPGTRNAAIPVAWWNLETFLQALWGTWFIGTAVFAAIQIRRVLNLRRLIAGARTPNERVRQMVVQVAEELSVRPPPVHVVPGLPSPALCAWGAVSLLWPEGPLEQLSGAGLRSVVLHELIHLKRRDHWIGWLELLAGCGWWWNPLFWYVRHQLHENAELACDSWVVTLLPDGRRAYAEALVDVAQGGPVSPLSGVVLGVGDGSRKLLERRLVMIMRGQVGHRVPAIGLALIALAAVPLVASSLLWQRAVSSETAAEQIGSTDAPAEAVAEPVEPSVEQAGSLETPEAVPADPFRKRRDRLQASEEDPTSPSLVKSPVPATPANSSDQDPFARPQAAANSKAKSRHNDTARLEQLEKQLAEVLVELQRIRGGQNPPRAKPAAPAASYANAADPLPVQAPTKKTPAAAPAFKPQTGRAAKPQRKPASGILTPSDDDKSPGQAETVTLMRVSYRGDLPIQELGQFLRHLLNDDVEVKVINGQLQSAYTPGDALAVKEPCLQITAMQDDSEFLARFIRLFQKRARKPTDQPRNLDEEEGAVTGVPVTRAHYKLPRYHAEMLRTFLEAQQIDDIDVKVKGELAVVTASSEDQQTLEYLIRLVQRKGRPAGMVDDSESTYNPQALYPAGSYTQAPTVAPYQDPQQPKR